MRTWKLAGPMSTPLGRHVAQGGEQLVSAVGAMAVAVLLVAPFDDAAVHLDALDERLFVDVRKLDKVVHHLPKNPAESLPKLPGR